MSSGRRWSGWAVVMAMSLMVVAGDLASLLLRDRIGGTLVDHIQWAAVTGLVCGPFLYLVARLVHGRSWTTDELLLDLALVTGLACTGMLLLFLAYTWFFLLCPAVVYGFFRVLNAKVAEGA